MSETTFENIKFTQKEMLIYKSVKSYFDKLDVTIKNKIYDIVMSPTKTCISLRILDWFATEYSKTSGIELKDINNRNIHIYISYKAQLKTYGKKNFDPFRRHTRFAFGYKNMVTNIAQLNFFRWAITNNIMDYIEEHIDELTKIMNSSNLNKKKKKEDKSNSKSYENKSIDTTFINNEISDDDINLQITF